MSAFAARQLVIPADPGHIKVPPPSAQTIRKYPEISDTLLDITMSPHTVKCLPFEAAYPNKLRKISSFISTAVARITGFTTCDQLLTFLEIDL